MRWKREREATPARIHFSGGSVCRRWIQGMEVGLFTCGRRPTGQVVILVHVVVVVVVVVVEDYHGINFFYLNHPVGEGGSHPILKS